VSAENEHSTSNAEMTERLSRAVSQVKPDLEDGSFEPDATFVGNLGVDSLETAEIVLAIEKEFNVSLSETDVKSILTASDAVKCIRNKLETNLSVTPA
jgi:acyl carrier protein